MSPTEYWFWEHTDEFGKRRKTTWKMARATAEHTLKDPTPIEHSREVRNLPRSTSEWHMTGAFRNQHGGKPQAPPTPGAKEPAI